MKQYHEFFYERTKESWEGISTDDFLGYIKTKIETALTWEELAQKLNEKRVLNVKLGVDPTGAELHLGHLVPVLLLKQFLRAGHHIDFVIGDFTARIGDPSGRDSARAPLTEKDIENNFSTYKEQIAPYLDLEKTSIRRNSEWLLTMGLGDLFPLLQGVNLSEAMQRDDFRTRTKNSEGVSLAEATYGVLMGIDSVHLNTDIELGGVDQLLNFQQCRSVLAQRGLPKEVALTTPILLGTSGDGRKMSKSFGNYIPLNASSEEKFGKIMSIPDNLILPYFISFADVHEKEVLELSKFIDENPLEAKKQLATFLVLLSTGDITSAQEERQNFERKFSKGEISHEDLISLKASSVDTVFDVLMNSGQFESKSELRRLFDQNAVVSVLDTEEKTLSLDVKAHEIPGTIRVGKRKFFRINNS